jgi:hypothetical protein
MSSSFEFLKIFTFEMTSSSKLLNIFKEWIDLPKGNRLLFSKLGLPFFLGNWDLPSKLLLNIINQGL